MNMKYYNLLAILLLSGMIACSGDKKDSSEGEETVETVLPDETNEVTVMTLKATDFNHELVSNGKLSARRHVDLRFQSAEPIATIHVKNGDRVSKGQKLAELSTFRLKNKTATSKDALERAKLELQDVLIGQGYALADSAKVPPATMQLVRVKSGYDQALIFYLRYILHGHRSGQLGSSVHCSGERTASDQERRPGGGHSFCPERHKSRRTHHRNKPAGR